MAKQLITNILPPLIDDERFNRNGMLPNASLMKRLAEGFNFIAGRCKKQVFMKCQPLDAIALGDPANVVWPFYFRTGENTTGLRVAFAATMTDYGFSSPPEVNLIVTTAAGAGAIDKSWIFPATNSGTTVVPDLLQHVQDLLSGLSANTEYKGHWQLTNGARLVMASLTEADSRHADDTVTAVCNPTAFVAEGPIYDAHIADLVEANTELWQHNGAMLIAWTADYDEDDGPITDAAFTTYTNVIDAVSTTVTAATPGWNLFTQYHNTESRTTVPVKLAVKTDRTAGAGTLDIKLTDGTNNMEIATLADVDGWSTATFAIPAQAGTKWDLWCKVSVDTTVFRVMGVYLWEYEA